jgi:hypothetical protein
MVGLEADAVVIHQAVIEAEELLKPRDGIAPVTLAHRTIALVGRTSFLCSRIAGRKRLNSPRKSTSSKPPFSLHLAAWYGHGEDILLSPAPVDIPANPPSESSPLGWVSHGSANCGNSKGDTQELLGRCSPPEPSRFRSRWTWPIPRLRKSSGGRWQPANVSLVPWAEKSDEETSDESSFPGPTLENEDTKLL